MTITIIFITYTTLSHIQHMEISIFGYIWIGYQFIIVNYNNMSCDFQI